MFKYIYIYISLYIYIGIEKVDIINILINV